MKRLKKMAALLAAVAVFVLLPDINALTVSAEEPVTYYVKYVEHDSEWRFQTGSIWDDNGVHRELYYMLQDIKDGDLLIVDGITDRFLLDVPVHLSNLTVFHASTVVVTAKGIDDCYVLADSIAAVNGNVTNAYVYGNARCTFNDNVSNLNIRDNSGLHATVTVGGTVNYLNGKDDLQTYYEYYNFAAGKFATNDGRVQTDAAYYSTTASDQASVSNDAGTNPASQDTASTQADNAQSKPSAGEYDDVPKTGEGNLILWLLGISAICFAGRYYLKKA